MCPIAFFASQAFVQSAAYQTMLKVRRMGRCLCSVEERDTLRARRLLLVTLREKTVQALLACSQTSEMKTRKCVGV